MEVKLKVNGAVAPDIRTTPAPLADRAITVGRALGQIMALHDVTNIHVDMAQIGCVSVPTVTHVLRAANSPHTVTRTTGVLVRAIADVMTVYGILDLECELTPEDEATMLEVSASAYLPKSPPTEDPE